jgi:hypothetical protein
MKRQADEKVILQKGKLVKRQGDKSQGTIHT